MKYISGIQQIGVGVSNVYEAWKWYKKNLGFDIKIFDDPGTAKLMLPYTGGQPQARHAVLAVNMQGGGGLEIWQYTSRTPRSAKFEIYIGDLGIYAVKIKTRDIQRAYNYFIDNGIKVLGQIEETAGIKHFYLEDPFYVVGKNAMLLALADKFLPEKLIKKAIFKKFKIEP